MLSAQCFRKNNFIGRVQNIKDLRRTYGQKNQRVKTRINTIYFYRNRYMYVVVCPDCPSFSDTTQLAKEIKLLTETVFILNLPLCPSKCVFQKHGHFLRIRPIASRGAAFRRRKTCPDGLTFWTQPEKKEC